TSKSTPSSAWTGPKCLVTPSRARRGVFELIAASFRSVVWPGAPHRATSASSPGAARGVPSTGYVIPAALHAAAYAAVQTCAAVQNLSLMMVSLMLLFVTATGVSRSEGTSFLPLLTLSLRMLADGVWPLARATATTAAS